MEDGEGEMRQMAQRKYNNINESSSQWVKNGGITFEWL
jgi:hypothetical protein